MNLRPNAFSSDSTKHTPGVSLSRHFRLSFDKETSETQSTCTHQVRNYLLAKASLLTRGSGFVHADPHLPLLVWIDDDEFSIPRVVDAAKQGITVFQFVSTAAVKAWVMINLGNIFFEFQLIRG